MVLTLTGSSKTYRPVLAVSNNFFYEYISSCVLHDSVLDPLLFTMYTTYVLISSHHLFAWWHSTFFSFRPHNFDSNVDLIITLVYFLKSEINHLQQIRNSLACTVVKAPKFSHITSILRSLHWLNINERIEYKLLSLTYKVLKPTMPIQSDLWSVYT